MSDEKTDPGFGSKASDALKKATTASDPWADRALEAAKGSAYTPWIIVALVLVCVVFGAWMVR